MTQKLVDFNVTEKGLEITILPQSDAREEVEEIQKNDHEADTQLCEVTEWQICNGWTFLSPSDHLTLGNLTEAPTFSQDIDHDDQGNLLRAGKIYYYNDYQIKDPLEVLLREGRVFFDCAE